MARDEVIERMDAIADELKTLRGEFAMLSDHTYMLDALRERVKELEADKRELSAIVYAHEAALDGQTDIGPTIVGAQSRKQARAMLEAYCREHGGTL
jgi:hypothetical protein